jgi:peptidoglycan/LPS O-acetylase OafA/YrhL
MMKNRDVKMNFRIEISIMLKGILAIGIVLHHLALKTSTIWVLDKFITLGAPIVSIFFFISGYGLLTSLLKKREYYFQNFFSKRFIKLLIPFFISIIIFQICNFYKNSNINIISIFQNLFLDGDTFNLLPYSWYVFVISILYLIFYFTFRNNKIELIERVFLTLFFSIVLIFAFKLMHFQTYWFITILSFSLGLFCKLFEEQIEKMIICSNYFWVILLNVLLLIKIFGGYHFVSMCLYPLFIYLMLKKVYIPNNKILLLLGKISYEVYLIQGISIIFLRSELFYIKNDYLYIITTVLITVVLAFLINTASSIIIKKR